MGRVKARRRLAEDGSPYQAARPESAPYQAMQKQQRAKAGMKLSTRKGAAYPRQLAKHLQAKVLPPAP